MGILYYADPRVQVPDVYNLTQSAAGTAISGVGLIVGTVSTDNHETVAAGSVFDQSPAAGVWVLSGSSVDISVSEGTAAVDDNWTVTSDANDGWTWGSNNLNSTAWIITGWQGGDPRHGWIRFTGLDIPQGSTINSAYLSLGVYDRGEVNGVKLDIYAHDDGNSGVPSSASNIKWSSPTAPQYAGWWLTTATQLWTVPTSSDGVRLNSPDISNVVQEIVSRGDFSSGNAICFVLRGDPTGSPGEYMKYWADYDTSGGTLRPMLYVNYSA